MSIRLTREAILGIRDLQTEEVHVPEWGGTVLVRGLTGAERDEFEASVLERRGKSRELNLVNLRAKLVARCVVDESGARLFLEDDVAVLGTKSAAALQRVFEACQRLSGMSEADVEELTGNLDGGPSGSTPSRSPNA